MPKRLPAYNYSHEILKRWIDEECARFRDDDLTVQHFADKLAKYSSSGFHLNHLNKLKCRYPEKRLKTLTLNDLATFAGYRNEPIEDTKKWLNWHSPDEMPPIPRIYDDSDLVSQIDELKREMKQLKEKLSAIARGTSYTPTHPYTLEVVEVLKNSGIDPDTQDGRSQIAAIVPQEKQRSIFEILSGESDPSFDMAWELLMIAIALCGSEKITTSLRRELGAVDSAERMPQLALALA